MKATQSPPNSLISLSSRLALAAMLCGAPLAWADRAAEHSHGHAQQHAHVHGVVALDVALDGHGLTLALRAPLADIAGFEHAPQTDEQRKQAADALARLRDGARWFKPAASAECRLEDVDIEAETLGEHGHGDSDGKHAHQHDHAEKKEAKEAHGHDRDDGRHGDKHDEPGHADLEALYTFHCEKTAALKSVEVELFKGFPTIQTINAQVASDKGQSRQTLTPGKARLALGR